MTQFKTGDIVQDGTYISSIKAIENGYAFFSENYAVKLDKLNPVKIMGGFDDNIIIESDIKVRASIVPPGKSVPMRRLVPYYECSIDGVPIISIVNKNHFCYVHQLQAWISIYKPDYNLRTRY